MIYIIFLIFIFIIFALAFYQWQFFMIFSPNYYRQDELDEHFEELRLFTNDGVELEGVVFTPTNPDATLLFFAGRSQDSVGLIKRLSLTFTSTRIITFNYRSYGKSGGKLSEKNILEDGLFVAKEVQKFYGDFYILGYSLGSSVASYVASKHIVKAVFLVGVYDSVAAIAKKKFGFDISLFFRYKFDNTKQVNQISSPTFVFVSKSDTTTYIENSREIKKYYKNLVFYTELDNIDHKDLLWNINVVEKINMELRNQN